MKIKNELKKLFSYIYWLKDDIKPFTKSIILINAMMAFGSLSGVAIAIASKNVIDNAVAGSLEKSLVGAIFFAGIVVLTMGINVCSSLITVRVSETMSNKMRQRFFKRFMRTEWEPLSKYHSGDLLTRMTSDVGTITSGIVNVIPGILALGVQLIAAFGTLFHYDSKLAVTAFVMAPIMLLFSRVWGRKLKHIQIKVQESESTYRSYIQEALQNLLIIKSFRLEDQSQSSLQGLHEKRMVWILKRNRVSLTASTILGLGYWAGYFLAFMWGAIRISQKAITFGTMTVFLQLVGQVQGPFIGLARSIPQIISMMASIDRLKEVENIEQEKTVGDIPKLDAVGMSIRDTSFNYTDGERVLNKISAEIHPGEIVALVGPSGEGKTTVIRLILALLQPNEGNVCFIDKKGSAYEVSPETRDWISYVPQGNTLFSGTIADNLKYGNPEATFEEMKDAVTAASAWEFIEKLPNGLDTIIGEKGLGLSEGQAQRISIARAFLKNAPFLILDEATSALDAKSEMHVLGAIKNLKSNCTCLVITHRPSALKICSRVLRLENGFLKEDIVS